jgi:hypothetical protein
VADDHRGDATGYGETAWNAATKTVLYICGDWTDPDPIEADMLAIDGVEKFVSEAEGLPDGWWDAEVVYPDDPAPWVTDRSLSAAAEADREQDEPDDEASTARGTDDAYAEALALASAPLLTEAAQEPLSASETLLAALRDGTPADPESLGTEALRAALDTLERSHRSTTEGVMSLVASAVKERGTSNGDRLAAAAIEAVRQFAIQPPPAAPVVTVNVPEQEPPHVDVHVAAAEAPQVHVTVPEQRIPDIHVTMPETKIDVHVPAPQVDVHVPQSKPRAVRVEYDPETGDKVYVQEDLDD